MTERGALHAGWTTVGDWLEDGRMILHSETEAACAHCAVPVRLKIIQRLGGKGAFAFLKQGFLTLFFMVFIDFNIPCMYRVIASQNN